MDAIEQDGRGGVVTLLRPYGIEPVVGYKLGKLGGATSDVVERGVCPWPAGTDLDAIVTEAGSV